MKIRYLLLLIPICLACSRQPFDLSTQRDSEQMDSKGETRSVSRDAGADCFLFPVVKDWSLFSSYADRVSFFQIPDTIVTSLSKEALAACCLDYPLLGDVLYFNTREEGIRTVLSRFNGFIELLTRKGAWETVSTLVNLRKSNRVNIGLTLQEQNEMNRMDDIWDSILNLDELVLTNTSQERNSILINKNDRTALYPVFTLKTPNRTVVPNTYDLPELLTSSDKSLEAYRMHTFYPHCSVVSEATTTYNCHFYAFSELFPQETAWLGWQDETSEDVYWEDGSYVETAENDPDARILSYVYSNHTALIEHGDTVVSKWSDGCLMRHSKYDGPFNSDAFRYFKKTDMTLLADTTDITLFINGHYQDRSFKLTNSPSSISTFEWEVNGGGRILSGQGTDSVRVRIYDSSSIATHVTTTYGRTVVFSTPRIDVGFLQPFIFSYDVYCNEDILGNDRRMLIVTFNNAPRACSWSLKRGGVVPPESEAYLEEAFLGSDASFAFPEYETIDFRVFYPGDYEISCLGSGPFGTSMITIPVTVSGTDQGVQYTNLQYNWGSPVIQNATCPPMPPVGPPSE